MLDYSYSWSNYLSTIDNNGWLWRSTGDTETHRLNGSWVLFRNGDIKTGFDIAIAEQDPGAIQTVGFGVARRTPEPAVIIDGAEVVAPAVAVVQQLTTRKKSPPAWRP